MYMLVPNVRGPNSGALVRRIIAYLGLLFGPLLLETFIYDLSTLEPPGFGCLTRSVSHSQLAGSSLPELQLLGYTIFNCTLLS